MDRVNRRAKYRDFLFPALQGGDQSVPVFQSGGHVNLQFHWEEPPIRMLIVTQQLLHSGGKSTPVTNCLFSTGGSCLFAKFSNLLEWHCHPQVFSEVSFFLLVSIFLFKTPKFSFHLLLDFLLPWVPLLNFSECISQLRLP